VFIIFFIGALSETNRAPMDLAEADKIKSFYNDLASLKTTICWKPLTTKILYIFKVIKLSFEQSAGTKVK
jgi:NADH:ubiquinone oxidoreductase subunit H